MSSTVKLAAGLPDGDRNGLAGLAPSLVHDPEATHVALVVLKTSKLNTDVETGTVQPTLRITAIEPVTAGADAAEVRRLLRRAFEARTGMVELPLELEREFDALGVDTSTGEIPEQSSPEVPEPDDTFGQAELPPGDDPAEDPELSGSDTAPEADAAEPDDEPEVDVPDDLSSLDDGPGTFGPGFSDQS